MCSVNMSSLPKYRDHEVKVFSWLVDQVESYKKNKEGGVKPDGPIYYVHFGNLFNALIPSSKIPLVEIKKINDLENENYAPMCNSLRILKSNREKNWTFNVRKHNEEKNDHLLKEALDIENTTESHSFRSLFLQFWSRFYSEVNRIIQSEKINQENSVNILFADTSDPFVKSSVEAIVRYVVKNEFTSYNVNYIKINNNANKHMEIEYQTLAFLMFGIKFPFGHQTKPNDYYVVTTKTEFMNMFKNNVQQLLAIKRRAKKTLIPRKIF